MCEHMSTMYAFLLLGHASCVEFVKKFNVPLLLLGGGGYTIRNVSRVWAYETAIALGVDLPEELPFNDYFEYYSPDYRVEVPASNMVNLNTREYLDKCKQIIIENLRHTEFCPSVPLQGKLGRQPMTTHTRKEGPVQMCVYYHLLTPTPLPCLDVPGDYYSSTEDEDESDLESSNAAAGGMANNKIQRLVPSNYSDNEFDVIKDTKAEGGHHTYYKDLGSSSIDPMEE